MTYTTVGEPKTDVEKQKNDDIPASKFRFRIRAEDYCCRVSFFTIFCLLLAGFIVSLSFGAYYAANPDKVILVKDGCLISVNGTVCNVYTVPEMYNQTIPCNTPVPPKRLDSLYDCWYSRGHLSLVEPSTPEWPIAPLMVGVFGTAVFGIFTLAFLVIFIQDTYNRCRA